MRTTSKSFRVTNALLDCVEKRTRQLSNIPFTAYVAALIRADLSNPQKDLAEFADLSTRQNWYQDDIDDKIKQAWDSGKFASKL